MLTLILLVVLGGGVGIMAVSMAERKPATDAGGSSRGGGAAAGDGAAPDAGPTPPPAKKPRPPKAPRPEARTPRERRRERAAVPASQTAVEGRLADLVRPSIPRRIASLVGVAIIVVAVGVGIATLLAAIVGAAAEILDNTIG